MNVPRHSSWPTNSVILNNNKFNLCFWEGKKEEIESKLHREFFVFIYLIKSDVILITIFIK